MIIIVYNNAHIDKPESKFLITKTLEIQQDKTKPLQLNEYQHSSGMQREEWS